MHTNIYIYIVVGLGPQLPGSFSLQDTKARARASFPETHLLMQVPRLSEERPKLDCKRAISAFLPTTDQSPWLSRTTSSTKSKSSKSMANKHQM